MIVEADPASVSFAALAEEYRRAGRFDDAIATCLAGLVHHPAYASARVTLGRALMEAGRPEEAQTEFEQVVRAAPENLAAIRALATLHERKGDRAEPAAGAPGPANASPASAGAPAAAAALPASAGAPAATATLPASAGAPAAAAALPASAAPDRQKPAAAEPDPALPDLEAFLSAIRKTRHDTRNPRPDAGS